MAQQWAFSHTTGFIAQAQTTPNDPRLTIWDRSVTSDPGGQLRHQAS